MATTLDFARTLILVDIVDGRVTARKESRLAATAAPAIAKALEAAGTGRDQNAHRCAFRHVGGAR